MLSLNTPKPLSLFHHHHHHATPLSYPFLGLPKPPHKPTNISATLNPSRTPPSSSQQLYQPFRPPPPPLPSQFRSLDPTRRLDILANRLGLWFDYASLIPSLIQDGFTSSSIEESTGISAVEQNRLVVASQVRGSLVQSSKTVDPQTLSFFDNSGAELLYEIRLLSATQRAAAACYVVQHKLDAKGAQDLARAMKDFPRRRGDIGWESFDYTLPGDCLSFMYYRQSREHKNPSEQRTASLQQALQLAVTEKAKGTILKELHSDNDVGKGKIDGIEDGVRVPVVRLKVGEVAEATVVVMLPVCRAEEREKEVLEAPWKCENEGEFGVVVAEKGWRRWVVLPGWEPVVGLGKGGVVVAFRDARVLPWKANRWYKEEAILVVADRGRKEVAVDDGFYLVAVDGSSGSDGLKVERGLALKEMGVKESLGTVVLVVRPPRDDIDDQLSDEDWE